MYLHNEAPDSWNLPTPLSPDRTWTMTNDITKTAALRNLAAECAREKWNAFAEEHRANLKPLCEDGDWEAAVELLGSADAVHEMWSEWEDAQEEAYTALRAQSQDITIIEKLVNSELDRSTRLEQHIEDLGLLFCQPRVREYVEGNGPSGEVMKAWLDGWVAARDRGNAAGLLVWLRSLADMADPSYAVRRTAGYLGFLEEREEGDEWDAEWRKAIRL